MDNIICGLIGGALATFFAAYFNNRKDRNILIEKWMNHLRDEISVYLGKCEQLRLLGLDLDVKKTDFSNPLYSEIVSSVYRLELLLDIKKEDQNKLIDEIKKLRKSADSKSFSEFEKSEKTLYSKPSTFLINIGLKLALK